VDYLDLGSGIALTNVPGPSEPTRLDGFRMRRVIGAPFLMDGMGLLFLATSYEDHLAIQFLSTPEMLPDVDFFNDCLQVGCDEMSAVFKKHQNPGSHLP
jgi:hypothetical protein